MIMNDGLREFSCADDPEEYSAVRTSRQQYFLQKHLLVNGYHGFASGKMGLQAAVEEGPARLPLGCPLLARVVINSRIC